MRAKERCPSSLKMPLIGLTSFLSGEGASPKCNYVNSSLGENAFIYSMGHYLKASSHSGPESGHEIGVYISFIALLWGPYPIPLWGI
jgi:hypothetical protein